MPLLRGRRPGLTNLLRASVLAPNTGALPSPLPLSITAPVAWSILTTTPLPMVAAAIRHSIPFTRQNAPVNVALDAQAPQE
jgi:hypothetical protein